MEGATLTTRQKALALNGDATTYGTFAEIGGQEVARWFFLSAARQEQWPRQFRRPQIARQRESGAAAAYSPELKGVSL